MTLCERCFAELSGPKYPPEVDVDRRVVMVDGEERRITSRLLRLFGIFYSRLGKLVRRESLIVLIWDDESPDDAAHMLRQMVCDLRKVIDGSCYRVDTAVGEDGGYRMEYDTASPRRFPNQRKLTEEQITRALSSRVVGSGRALGHEFDVSPSTITRVRQRGYK